MFATASLVALLGRVFGRGRVQHKWAARTLIVGPVAPVDGDSLGCTKAIIEFLRKKGLEAWTLPTSQMFQQINWIITRDDIHPACLGSVHDGDFVTHDLQAAYDAVLAHGRPDEIIIVDGPRDRLGFDPRGVPVYCIDHHMGQADADRNDKEAFIQHAPAAGCLLIEHFGIYEPILAVSILTDTFWLRQNMPADAIRSLGILTEHGLTNELLCDLQTKLMVQKDPAILAAIQSSRWVTRGDAVFAVLTTSDPELHRNVVAEWGYFRRHICVVRADGYTSLRTSDKSIDLRPLVEKHRPDENSGGGHPQVAAITFHSLEQELLDWLCADFLELVS